MFLRSEVEFIELFLIDRAGRVCEQALAALCLRKRDAVPDIVGAGKQHNESVKPERDTAVWRRSVLERL